MSLLLNDFSLQYAERLEFVPVSFPFAIGCWFYLDEDIFDQTLVSLANNGSEDSFYALSIRGVDSDGYGQVRASIVDDSGKIEQADSSIGININTWHHALGVWVAEDDIRVYLDGDFEGLSPGISGATTPTGLNTTAIGRISKQTPQDYVSGRVAEVSIWDLTSTLDDDEINDLGADRQFSLMVRSDELIFYAPINNADDPIVDVIGHRNLSLFNSPIEADHPPIQYYEEEIFLRFRSGPIEFQRDIATAFNITHQANWELEKKLLNSFGFNQNVQHNVKVISVETNISFGQSTQKQATINVALEHSLSFEPIMGPTVEESVSNNISFTQEAARAEDPSNDIEFTQDVNAVASKGASNSLSFSQEVTPEIELTLPIENNIQFTQDVVAWKDEPCDRYEYTPYGVGLPAITTGTASSISLVCGASSIVLRNPNFGNSESLDVDRALNRSRGGTPNIYRDPNWPESTTINIQIAVMKESEAKELLDFLLDCLGQLITYTDYENRVWEGIVTNPNEAIIENRPDIWSANIELIGNPV